MSLVWVIWIKAANMAAIAAALVSVIRSLFKPVEVILNPEEELNTKETQLNTKEEELNTKEECTTLTCAEGTAENDAGACEPTAEYRAAAVEEGKKEVCTKAGGTWTLSDQGDACTWGDDGATCAKGEPDVSCGANPKPDSDCFKESTKSGLHDYNRDGCDWSECRNKVCAPDPDEHGCCVDGWSPDCVESAHELCY